MKMDNTSETLARSITRSSSKQADFIARLMVDKHLVDDFYRAYAYFRWADDVIDDQCQSAEERHAFIKRQKKLIDHLYGGERPDDIQPEEQVLVDLIRHNADENKLLQSYTRNVLSTLEFDVKRHGRLISEQELIWYSDSISRGVTDVLLYSIGSGYNYPESKNRYYAVIAAHITHMLRDYVEDVPCGYINIQREYLESHGIDPGDVENPAFREWVKKRVELARRYFKEGKRYIDGVDILRFKIMAYSYCYRFETILDTIERDNYILRAEYNNRKSPLVWLKIIFTALKVTIKHFIRGREMGT